jgi:hypothetical protein
MKKHQNQEIPVEFTNGSVIDPCNSDNVKCPVCGMGSMHQHDVKVYYRHREDGPTNRIAVVATTVAFNVVEDEENPSLRRDGLAIKMECEGCRSELELAVWQHKGGTYLGWSKVVPDTDTW